MIVGAVQEKMSLQSTNTRVVSTLGMLITSNSQFQFFLKNTNRVSDTVYFRTYTYVCMLYILEYSTYYLPIAYSLSTVRDRFIINKGH